MWRYRRTLAAWSAATCATVPASFWTADAAFCWDAVTIASSLLAAAGSPLTSTRRLTDTHSSQDLEPETS